MGNAIINSGKYSYSPNYFHNFDSKNSDSTRSYICLPEYVRCFSTNNTDIQNRWWPTFHYNQYTPLDPQAGWNGFATIAEFYNSFAVNDVPITQTAADTLLKDRRIGGRFYPGCTDKSGVRPGFLIGQQYNEDGEALKDRNNNPLMFLPNIASGFK